MFCQAEAQVNSRCPVCPPSLRGVPDGYALRDSSGYARWQSVAGFDTAAIGVDSLSNLFWGLNGNSGNSASNFIGTTGSVDFVVKTDAAERLRLNAGGGGNMELNGNNFRITDTVNQLTIAIDDSIGAKAARLTSVTGTSQYTAAVGSFGISLFHTHLTNGQLDGFLSIVDYENSLVRSPGNGRSLFISNTNSENILSIRDSVSARDVSVISSSDSVITLLTNYSSKVKLVDNAMLGIYSDVQKWKIDSNGLAHFNSVKITDGTQGAGKVLTSDANGLASWGHLSRITHFDSIAIIGDTVIIPNHTETIIVSSGAVTDAVWSFPTGVDGDELFINNTQNITTLTIIGTGTGTISAAKKALARFASNSHYDCVGGNWY